MAFWPFRRKSGGRKRSRSGATLSDQERAATAAAATTTTGIAAPPRTQTDDPNVARRPSQKKQRTESSRLHRRARTFSFDAGRRDSIRVGSGAGHVPKPTTAAKPLPAAGRSATTAAVMARPDGDAYDSGGDGTFWGRIPTLHNKKDDGSHNPPRRKSSKRRREDMDREAELRALSNFVPLRPATDSWTAGRPMKKDSKRVKTGLPGFGRENRSSLISLPSAESLRSSMSSDSEMGSYRLGRLEALAPRPTLRYSVPPRWGPPSAGSGPTRAPSQKRKLVDRPSIPEATLKAHKRIDDLANDLDASDLRELMERDQRRRALKHRREQERMERRLRRAERQQLADSADGNAATASSPHLERGVLGREMVGLGIDTTSAIVTSSKRRPSDEMSPKQRGKLPETSSQPVPKPLKHFHRVETMPPETPLSPPAEKILEEEPEKPKQAEQAEELEDLPPPPLPVINPRRKLLRSKRSRSHSPLEETTTASTLPPGKVDELDEIRKDSNGSHRSRLSFSSIFKWAGRNRTSGGSTQSSFANTSREEMQAAAAQAQAQAQARAQTEAQSPEPVSPVAPALPANFIPARTLSSGVPKRTMSRFREDLPEGRLLSPPDSRMQSPEADPALPAVSEQQNQQQENHSERNTPIPMRFDTPTSGHRSLDEAMRYTPTSWHRGDSTGDLGPSPEPQQSVSLASIDSEASWLSGRLTGRRSSLQRESLRRYHQHGRTASGDTTTNDTEDGFNRDDSPEPQDAAAMDDEADMKWGSVDAYRRPSGVIHHAHDEHNAEMMRSRVGLVNDFDDEKDRGSPTSQIRDDDDDDDSGPDDVDVVVKLEDAGLQRATSINLSRSHARHISAGSAKLLDLTPRGSGEQRRSSEGRRSSAMAFL